MRLSVDWSMVVGLLQVIVLVYQVYIQYKAELGERGILLPLTGESLDSALIQTELTMTVDLPLEAVGHGVIVEDYAVSSNGVASRLSHSREERLLYPGTASNLSVMAEIPQEMLKKGGYADSFTIEICLQLRTLTDHTYGEQLKVRLCQSSSNRYLWSIADSACRIEDGFLFWIKTKVSNHFHRVTALFRGSYQ